MSEPIKTKEELVLAVSQTLSEVKEILKKSGIDMPTKEDEELESDKIADRAIAKQAADKEGAAKFAEDSGDKAELSEEGKEEKVVPEEGEEEKDKAPSSLPASDAEEAPEKTAEGEEDMAEHAKQLSDEELTLMLEVLMAEKERRSVKPEAPLAGEEEVPEKKDEKAMKSELDSLAKSLADVARSVKTLVSEVEGLKKSVAAASTKKSVVVTKPAVSDSVRVLQKSQEPEQRLSKSETLEFLYNLQKNGDKLVNSSVIADVNACQTDAELALVQKRLMKSGIKFPAL